MALPTIGRIVIYRHPLPKGGSYDVPAVVSATPETVKQARDAGLDSRHVRDLSGEEHLHLTVLTPLVTCPDGVEHARDVPPADPAAEPLRDEEPAPGTWRWPPLPAPSPIVAQTSQAFNLPLDSEQIRQISEAVARHQALRMSRRGSGWGI